MGLPAETSMVGTPSTARAWFYLIGLSLQRQLRLRQMVWIALGLLAFAAAFVAVQTAAGRWNMNNWQMRGVERWPSLADRAELAVAIAVMQPRPFSQRLDLALAASFRPIMDQSPFRVFTSGMLMTVFLGFLLPIWSLSFAIESLGGERESNSLIWLLSRPVPRPAIYLAKFLALLPWTLAFNAGGFALICLLAGDPGRLAIQLFWPMVLWTSLAFAALFHLLGALFRRPTVIALLYVFFFEIIVNLMPGYIKRVSITYYARCMMFDSGAVFGIQPERPMIFLPVDGTTAQVVLAGVTAVLLILGTVLFTRTQFQDGI